MTFDRLKEVYENNRNKIMQGNIQNDAQPLYIVDPVNFPITASAKVSEAEDQFELTSFARMAD